MPTIYLCQDFECNYSDEDVDLVDGHCWMLHRTARNGKYYAYTYFYFRDPETNEPRRKKIYMHRLITGFPEALLVDHGDRNGLNNRRWNLRVTTGTYNGANSDLPENLCGYRGVSQPRSRRPYRARICFRGDEIHLGYFPTAREAAMAYDAKARELFGVFAWLNFNPDMDALRARETENARQLEEIPF